MRRNLRVQHRDSRGRGRNCDTLRIRHLEDEKRREVRESGKNEETDKDEGESLLRIPRERAGAGLGRDDILGRHGVLGEEARTTE